MNSRRVDLVGQKFGRWRVLHFVEQIGGSMMWQCRCDCGNERPVSANNFKYGRSRSCGCLQTETLAQQAFKHGQCDHPLYGAWTRAKNRCLNKNDQDFRYYGGRGIKVCDRWLLDFWNFWDDMAPGWRPGLTIERKNTNGNYEPANCCWASMKEQRANTRQNKQKYPD